MTVFIIIYISDYDGIYNYIYLTMTVFIIIYISDYDGIYNCVYPDLLC